MNADRELRSIEEILKRKGQGYEALELEELKQINRDKYFKEYTIGIIILSFGISAYNGYFFQAGGSGLVGSLAYVIWKFYLKRKYEA